MSRQCKRYFPGGVFLGPPHSPRRRRTTLALHVDHKAAPRRPCQDAGFGAPSMSPPLNAMFAAQSQTSASPGVELARKLFSLLDTNGRRANQQNPNSKPTSGRNGNASGGRTACSPRSNPMATARVDPASARSSCSERRAKVTSPPHMGGREMRAARGRVIGTAARDDPGRGKHQADTVTNRTTRPGHAQYADGFEIT